MLGANNIAERSNVPHIRLPAGRAQNYFNTIHIPIFTKILSA